AGTRDRQGGSSGISGAVTIPRHGRSGRSRRGAEALRRYRTVLSRPADKYPSTQTAAFACRRAADDCSMWLLQVADVLEASYGTVRAAATTCPGPRPDQRAYARWTSRRLGACLAAGP